MTSKTVKAPAISCGHCVKTIEREVGGLEGVVAVKADLGSKEVTVSWSEDSTDWGAIRNLMTEIGYPPQE